MCKCERWWTYLVRAVLFILRDDLPHSVNICRSLLLRLLRRALHDGCGVFACVLLAELCATYIAVHPSYFLVGHVTLAYQYRLISQDT